MKENKEIMILIQSFKCGSEMCCMFSKDSMPEVSIHIPIYLAPEMHIGYEYLIINRKTIYGRINVLPYYDSIYEDRMEYIIEKDMI